MPIVLNCVAGVVYLGLGIGFFRFLKGAVETKQDLLVIGYLVSFALLGSLILTGVVLFFAAVSFFVAVGTFGTLVDQWFLPLMRFCYYGSFLSGGCCSLYLIAIRLPLVSINRRRQRKALARLGWPLRKPKDILDVADFEHLLVIGITLWSFQDLSGMELFQRHFRCQGCSVQVFFMDDVSRLGNIQSFSPGTDAAWPTPVISEYHNGILTRNLYGEDALKWMKQA